MMHIMIDLETLGTTPGCPILSIGAVAFNQDGVQPAPLTHTLLLPRALSGASGHTLLWWLKQSDAARNAIVKDRESAIPARDALVALRVWVDDVRSGQEDKKLCVWANGASFDLPIIEHALTDLDITVPWKFWEHRCFRTAKALRGADGAKIVLNSAAHTALADAYYQAEWLIAIDKLYEGALLSEPE